MWEKISDTEDRKVRIDTSTHSMLVMCYSYSELHNGHSFCVEYLDSTMADTNTITLLLVTTTGTCHIHSVVGADTTGESTLEFFEAPTVSSNGTALTVYNRKRDNDTSSNLAYHTPSLSNNGTLLQTKYLGSAGVGQSSVGGDERNINEWILKADTKYLLKLTAHASLKGRIYINWYEHTCKGSGI